MSTRSLTPPEPQLDSQFSPPQPSAIEISGARNAQEAAPSGKDFLIDTQLDASYSHIRNVSTVFTPEGDVQAAAQLKSSGDRLRMSSEYQSVSDAPQAATGGGGSSVHNFLLSVPHLFMLTADQVAQLHIMVREFGEMDTVIEEGAIVQNVCVLAAGTVEVINPKLGLKRAFGHRRVGSITAPNVFALDEVILEQPSEFTYHASSAVTLLMINKVQFNSLCKQNPLFANSVGNQLSQSLRVFSIFQDFTRAVLSVSDPLSDISGGYRLPLHNIVDVYQSMSTVVHRFAHSPRIDVEALRYCIDRLPHNITQTYIITLARSLPLILANELESCSAMEEFRASRNNAGKGEQPISLNVSAAAFVHSRKRRRCAWKFGDRGQTLIIMRDGSTDLIDFVTCLCMFMVESRKIRARLQSLVSPSAVEILRQALVQQQEGKSDVAERVLHGLPFTTGECAAMLNVWPESVISKLYSIVLHREEYVVNVESGLSRRFAEDPLLNWSLSLQRHIRTKLNIPETQELPDNIVIDVFFAPNRTMKNLLCSMNTPSMREKVAAFVLKHKSCNSAQNGARPSSPSPHRSANQTHESHCGDSDDGRSSSSSSSSSTSETADEPRSHCTRNHDQWINDADEYYYYLTRMLESDNSAREEYRKTLKSNGFILLEDIFASALLIDLIDVDALDINLVDEGIREQVRQVQQRSCLRLNKPAASADGKSANNHSNNCQRRFIINVDKSFGAQVEALLRVLILTFGRHIRSVNLTGKSAGLVGQRGDVFVPDRLLFAKKAFGEDSADEIRPCAQSDCLREEVSSILSDRTCIHGGTSMTNPGVMLQNDSILKFYRTIYGCRGLEMQSSYIARQLEESRRIGLVPAKIPSRYLFYFDDMPLGNEDGSEIRSQTKEIISTIYATARSLIRVTLRPDS